MKRETALLTLIVVLVLAGLVLATTANMRASRQPPLAGGVGGPSPASTSPPADVATRTDPVSPSVSPMVDTAVAVQRATAYVVGLHSFDHRLPYPGWDPDAFRAGGAWILGGDLLADQKLREANITHPTAGDQRTYRLMAERQQVTTVVVTKAVPVIQSGTEVLVNLTWHTEGSTVDARDVVGSNQFTVITMRLSPDGEWLAVSDVMPQAP